MAFDCRLREGVGVRCARTRIKSSHRGGIPMKWGSSIFGLLVISLATTGCQCGPGGLLGGGLAGRGGGCSDGGCPDGNCGLLSRLQNRTCPDAGGPIAAGSYAGLPGGAGGPLAGHLGNHFRGHQSHLGSHPGPANGPPASTVTYPYYTTRAPRDFLASQPATIGR